MRYQPNTPLDRINVMYDVFGCSYILSLDWNPNG